MPTSVKNIKLIEHTISKETLDLCKKLDVLQFVPKKIPTSLEFELHDSCTEIANAFRRCINSELPILIMDFDKDDVVCDDMFIIVFELKRVINLIPIKQISDMEFSLDVYNDTNDVIHVMSSDIKENGKSTADKFSQSFIIADLEPGKRLQIKSIKLSKGVSFIDGTEYSYPSCVGYKCLDLDESKSSTEVSPKKFKLTVQKQQYEDPKYIVTLAAKTLEKKLNTLSDEINNYKNTMRDTNKLEISEQNDATVYKIYDETYTIGNLIVKYGLELDPSIKKISCIKMFSSDNFILLTVKHSNVHDFVIKAINMAKDEIMTVGKAF